ncbi:hypothetical protein [Acinetobacter geminorum]|uniref:hypothetical protein n=1 Tax=Acinetobacter geminorum TaxID=2730922 RepID=UPI003AF8F2D1
MNTKVFLYLSVFCISLDSYFRLRGIVGIGFLLIYLLTIKFEAKFDTKFLVPIFLMVAGFIVYTCLAFFFPNIYLQIPEDRETFVFKIFDRFSLIILALMIFWSFNKSTYALILRKVALFHIFYLLFQFSLYYGIGLKFDILGMFGIEQRTSMDYSGSTVFRPAGLFWEPSNFAAYVLALYLPYLIKNSNFRKKDFLLPVSIILTLSSAAFLVGSLVLATMLLKSGLIKRPKVLITAIIVGLPLLYFGYNSQKDRFSDGLSDNANTILRTNLVNYAWESRLNNPILLIGGAGLYSYDLYIHKEEQYPYGRSIASIQDATFFVFTYLLTGVVGLFLLFLLILNVKGFSNKLFVLTFMLTKISFLFPIFLFFIYMVFEEKISRKKLADLEAKSLN